MGRYRPLVAALVRHSNITSRAQNVDIGERVCISPVVWQVLEYLIEHEGEADCMNRISETLGIPQSSFSKIARQLTDLGLVERFRTASNRKNIILRPTEKAHRLYDSFSHTIFEHSFRPFFETLDAVDDEALACFTAALNRLNSQLAQDDPAPEAELIPLDYAGLFFPTCTISDPEFCAGFFFGSLFGQNNSICQKTTAKLSRIRQLFSNDTHPPFLYNLTKQSEKVGVFFAKTVISVKKARDKRKENKEMDKKKTYGRVLAILMIVLLLSSMAAHIVSTSGGRIKVERVTIDARGASMDGELYYPHGTSDRSGLPAVVVTHGAGVNSGNMKDFATELARRGFVVLNVSAYGAGLSEYPLYDEVGQGVEKYEGRTSPGGLLDAINFVRTLKFVDQTRLGIMGHSAGSRRISNAASVDCGYLSFNDIMINVLCDSFGQSFSEAEIQQNADELAKARLGPEELKLYEYIKEQKAEYFNTRILATLVVGGNAEFISPQKTVSVAGHEVQRNAQTNLGLIIGTFDSYTGYPGMETTLASFYRDEPIALDTWYSIDDAGKSSAELDNFFSASILQDEAMREARDSRSLRFVTMPVETHSRNMLSIASTSAAVKYFEQTLQYNNGELGEGSAIAYNNMIFPWREFFSGLSMLCMLLALVPFAGLLLGTRFFAPCLIDNSELPMPEVNGKKYWIFNAIIAILGFFAIYRTNSVFAPGLPKLGFLPLGFNWWMSFLYLMWVAIGAVILLVVFYFLDRKNGSAVQFKALRVGMRFVNILKTLLLAAILIVSAYVLMSAMVYLFNEDFKFWMAEFIEIKVEFWWMLIKCALLLLPELLLVGMLTNFTIRKDVPVWKEDLICVVVGSIGVYVCWLINYIVLHSGGPVFSNWTSSYGMLIVVPVATYMARKMYRISGSVWLGSFTNALLIAWANVCINGYSSFLPQSILSNFFNV